MSYERYKDFRLAPDDNGCWSVLDKHYQQQRTFPSQAAAKRWIDAEVQSEECLCKEDGFAISRTLCTLHGHPTPINSPATIDIDEIEQLVFAIRTDGWNNGYNTPNQPWVDQITNLITEKENRARVEGLKQYSKQCAILRMEPSTFGLKRHIDNLEITLKSKGRDK